METDQRFWTFVIENLGASPSALRLKYHGKGKEAEITQIECRQKFGKKLVQTLAYNPHFFFPSTLAGEQATSDLLAAWHASLIEPGSRVIDLTAGLGIDAMHLAREAAELVAIERDRDRAQALACNFSHAEGLQNCRAAEGDCIDFISGWQGEKFDYAFIDPARRAADGSRVFALADCEPDVTAMLPALRRVARRLIIKASPMLDISKMASELQGIERVIALGTTTECKELVAVVDLEGDARRDSYAIEAVTLFADGSPSAFSFTPAEEREAEPRIAGNPQPGDWLYEPYPSAMKAAPFNLLSVRFGLAELHANTHLYYGREDADGFLGERLAIVDVRPYESKYIKRLSRDYPAISVTARNFDVSAATLAKKLGVRDGGAERLFAVTAFPSKKLMIIARPEQRPNP